VLLAVAGAWGSPAVWPQAVGGGVWRPGNNRWNGLPLASMPTALVGEEAIMEDYFVWMTTRQIKPGTLIDFERAWRPGTHPDGMLRAYAYWSEDQREIVGVSFWTSRESCDAWRASAAEASRRAAMAGFVVGEREAFYRGRELHVPDR
jgi:heme-degrading monooxygenase HmoA